MTKSFKVKVPIRLPTNSRGYGGRCPWLMGLQDANHCEWEMIPRPINTALLDDTQQEGDNMYGRIRALGNNDDLDPSNLHP